MVHWKPAAGARVDGRIPSYHQYDVSRDTLMLTYHVVAIFVTFLLLQPYPSCRNERETWRRINVWGRTVRVLGPPLASLCAWHEPWRHRQVCRDDCSKRRWGFVLIDEWVDSCSCRCVVSVHGRRRVEWGRWLADKDEKLRDGRRTHSDWRVFQRSQHRSITQGRARRSWLANSLECSLCRLCWHKVLAWFRWFVRNDPEAHAGRHMYALGLACLSLRQQVSIV